MLLHNTYMYTHTDYMQSLSLFIYLSLYISLYIYRERHVITI